MTEQKNQPCPLCGTVRLYGCEAAFVSVLSCLRKSDRPAIIRRVPFGGFTWGGMTPPRFEVARVVGAGADRREVECPEGVPARPPDLRRATYPNRQSPGGVAIEVWLDGN